MERKELVIVVKDDFVLLVEKNNGTTVYEISRSELARIQDDYYSDWIMHLMIKTWIDIKTLYDLAVTISKLFPENNIDWYKTFYVVEKKEYLEFAGDLLLPKGATAVDDLFNRIKFGQDQSNDETNEIIDEIVKQKLKELHLNT